jgi:hypothetical protein
MNDCSDVQLLSYRKPEDVIDLPKNELTVSGTSQPVVPAHEIIVLTENFNASTECLSRASVESDGVFLRMDDGSWGRV